MKQSKQLNYVFGKNVLHDLVKYHHQIIDCVYICDQSAHLNFVQTHQLNYQIWTTQTFQQQFPGHNHQYIAASISQYPQTSWQQFKTRLFQQSVDQHPLILVLDHIQDSYNFGALIRTAVAVGVFAIIVPNCRQAPLNAAVNKASAGTLFAIPIIVVANLVNTLQTLQTHNYWICINSLKSDQHKQLPSNLTTMKLVLVVGNEGKGISHQIQKLADYHYKITMIDRVESLNVSVASAITLYEIRHRQ